MRFFAVFAITAATTVGTPIAAASIRMNTLSRPIPSVERPNKSSRAKPNRPVSRTVMTNPVATALRGSSDV